MSDAEQLQAVQHRVLQGMARVTFGLREIADGLDADRMSMREAAAELRFLANAMAHKLKVMSE